MSCFLQAALEWDREVGLGISRTGTKRWGRDSGVCGDPCTEEGGAGARAGVQGHPVYGRCPPVGLRLSSASGARLGLCGLGVCGCVSEKETQAGIMTTAPDSSLKELRCGGRTWLPPPWAGPSLSHAGPQELFWGPGTICKILMPSPFLPPLLLQWGTRPQASSSLSLTDNGSWRKCAEGLWGWRLMPSFALKALSHAGPAGGHMGGASTGMMGTCPGPPGSVQGPRQASSSGFWYSQRLTLSVLFTPPRPLRA